MPDREKVIKKAERIMCSAVDRDMIDSFCEDVIALLKEQEAEWLEVDEKHDAFDCSNCGAMAGRKCLYCPGCGAKMKNGTRAMKGR